MSDKGSRVPSHRFISTCPNLYISIEYSKVARRSLVESAAKHSGTGIFCSTPMS
jgi:hypothetical protein